MASHYKYESLKEGEIRILTVMPGTTEDFIFVRLDHINLADAEIQATERLLSPHQTNHDDCLERDAPENSHNTSTSTPRDFNLDDALIPPRKRRRRFSDGDIYGPSRSPLSNRAFQGRRRWSDGFRNTPSSYWTDDWVTRANAALQGFDEFSIHRSASEYSEWPSPQPDARKGDLLEFTEDACSFLFDGRDAGYEALSYAWGCKTRSHILHCTDGSYFNITKSLYVALRHLRYSDRERRIWADAVCINQSDLVERGNQVAIMAHVYRCAFCVLVWLGEAEPTDVTAFALLHASDEMERQDWLKYYLQDLGESVSSSSAQVQQDPLQMALVREPWCPCCKTRIPEYDIESLLSSDDHIQHLRLTVDKLLNRSWFTRLWIYQEVACAKSIEVYCGSHHISWDFFAGRSDPVFGFVRSSALTLLSTCREIAGRNVDPCDFIRLLMILGDKKCAEDQDRVFAVRSIAGIERIESLRPDYSVSAIDLYRRVFVECLADWDMDYLSRDRLVPYMNHSSTAGMPAPHASLLLALAGTYPLEKSAGAQHPSWLPAFDRLTKRSVAKYYEYSWHLGREFFSEELSSKRHASYSKRKAPLKSKIHSNFRADDLDILEILGCQVGTVLKKLEQSQSPFAFRFNWDSYATFADDLTLLKAAVHEWQSRCAEFVRAESRVSARSFKELMYCTSIMTGFDPELYFMNMAFPAALDGKEGITTDASLVFDFVRVSEWLTDGFLRPPADDKFRILRYYDHYRNLALISCDDGQQRFGWIPPSTAAGDTLNLFVGCPRPFALRQQADGTYKLLGDCWVKGVADDASLRISNEVQEWFSLS